MELRVIPACEVATIWPKVESYIASALEYEGREYAPSAIFEALEEGRMQLFTAGPVESPKAAAVVAIHEYPNVRRCRIHWCGGRDVETWVDLIKGIERWAVQNDCQAIRLSGRKGWRKHLDWDEQGVILGKAL